MAELYLVRHGQASFGEANYDQLSELGERQCQWLGEHFAELGLSFDRVLTGTQQRHAQSATALQRGLAITAADGDRHDAFNEYDFHLLVNAFGRQYPNELPPSKDDPRRDFFSCLGRALRAWSEGRLDTAAGESWDTFCQRVQRATEIACAPGTERCLVVSSGGLISAFVGRVLGVAPAMMFALNMQIANSSYSRLVFSGDRIRLSSFNNLPHLQSSERQQLITFS